MEFKRTEGEDLLTTYRQNDTTMRLFCSLCGSFLLTTHSADKNNVFISLGCLETDMESSPEYHQFVGNKANWEENPHNLRQHEAWPEWRLKRKS